MLGLLGAGILAIYALARGRRIPTGGYLLLIAGMIAVAILTLEVGAQPSIADLTAGSTS